MITRVNGMKREIQKELIARRAAQIAKERVYVDSADEVPEGAQVREGEQGGLWYESSEAEEGGGDDEEEGDDVEWVETEYGEVPDTDGPIPPDMRDEPIGSDSHPVLWKRPDGEEELEEYISEIKDTEWYGEGSEIFERAFHGDDNTEAQYTNEEGEWDSEREEKHSEWAEELLNEEAATDEDTQPIGMVLLGPPGAGKGWWQEQVEEGAYGETGEFVEREFTAISSDRTKEPIPEYDETNASEVHDEASKIAKENLAPQALEEEHNLIIDKVATTPDSTLNMIESMREKGYDIRANFVNVPTEKSIHNAVSRYYEEGRFTPLDYANGAGESSRESFNTILDEGDIPDEKAGRFDNDVEWGNAPEAEFIGEELLKAFLEVLQKYKYRPGEREHGENNGGTPRTGRERGRDRGVDGRGLRSRDRGRHGERDGRDDRVGKAEVVSAAESIFQESFEDFSKGRVYIDDPAEAPEGVNVQEGEEGGTYYETGSSDEQDSDEIAPGNEVTIENFGEEQDVTIVDPNLPGGILVEDEDGNQFSVGEGEIVGQESDAQDIVDDLMDDLESPDGDEDEEDEVMSEEERRELFEDMMDDIPELPEEPDGDEPIQGVETDVSEFSGGSRVVSESDIEAVSETLSEGSLLGLNMEMRDVESEEDYGPFEPSTGIALYDGEDSKYAHTDVVMDTDDFSNLQAQIHEEYSDVDRVRHFGTAEAERVEEYAESMEAGEEFPVPHIVMNDEGEVVNEQEGRHRALAALGAGVQEIPVRVVVEPGRDGKTYKQKREILHNAGRALESMNKQWVEDPTEQAPNRWTNTETGEHRYQESKPGTGSGSGQNQESDEAGGQDIDPDDYRTVALGEVDIEEGTLLDFGGEALEVETVVNDPSATFGPNAGYVQLSDGTYANLLGDRPGNGEMEDIPEDEIRAFTEADALVEEDPETAGTADVDDWSVDWDEVQYDNFGGGRGDRDLIRLDEKQKRRFRNEWEDAAPEEGVESVSSTMKTIKGSTMNTDGQFYDKLVKETFGVEGEPRSGDFEDADAPSEEAVEAMRMFAEASQKFAEETFGEEFEIHRGLGDHAKESVLEAAAEWYLDDADDTFEMRDNPASVWTTDDKMADSYSKNLKAHQRISSDEVMAMPEALLDFSATQGPDWNEGEVNVSGWDMEVTPDDFTVTSGHGDWDVTLRQAMENPVELYYEHDAGDEALRNLSSVVANHGPPRLAFELHKEITSHRGYDRDDEDMTRPVSRLEEAGREVIQDDDGSQVIDVRSESEWLSEAAREFRVQDEVVEEAVDKALDWLPLASESPDPQRERVDADWNEVEDEDELADKFLQGIVDKNRVYLDDPSEAPDGALVRQGRSGMWYYNTKQTRSNEPTRIYVSSPEKAPDSCTVRGGETGGYYYYQHEHPRGQR